MRKLYRSKKTEKLRTHRKHKWRERNRMMRKKLMTLHSPSLRFCFFLSISWFSSERASNVAVVQGFFVLTLTLTFSLCLVTLDLFLTFDIQCYVHILMIFFCVFRFAIDMMKKEIENKQTCNRKKYIFPQSKLQKWIFEISCTNSFLHAEQNEYNNNISNFAASNSYDYTSSK